MSGQVYSEPFAQIPEWILDADISDRAVRAFCVLQRHAGKDGRAFPGRTSLAERLKCSKASLDRALNELRHIGAIVSQNVVRDSVIVGNDYWLWPAIPSSPVSRGRRAGDATGRSTSDATSHHRRATEREPENESQEEREPENSASSSLAIFDAAAIERATTPFEDLFDEWYAAYPRKAGKGAARKAYASALKRASHVVLVDAAKRFAADVNRVDTFTPHPSTWLNQDRWLDAPLPSRTNVNGNAPRISQSVQNVQKFFAEPAAKQGEIGR